MGQKKSILKVGTRKSKLAIAQTNLVLDELKKQDSSLEFEIVAIQTKGDQQHHKPLRDIFEQGKAAFTSQIEEELREVNIDFAVHSMKDVVGNIRFDDITFPAFLERVSPLDVLILKEDYNSLEDLPEGYVVGTVSARRKAGLLRANSKLNVKNLRGNVQTRIAKLKGSHKWTGHVEIEYDAIVMAESAICRSGTELNLDGLNRFKIKETEMIPPAGQGVIGVQCRKEDKSLIDILSKINHPKTEMEVRCEREFLYNLGGNCHSVIGVFCQILEKKNQISLIAEVSEETGDNRFYIENSSEPDQYLNLAKDCANEIKKNIVSSRGIEYLINNLNLDGK